MDSLPATAACAIASVLLDERDFACLRCTCKYWRDLLDANNDALWTCVLHKRFGNGAGGAADDAPAAQRFCQLARLQQSACLMHVTWLNGEYLQVSCANPLSVARAKSTCDWLQLPAQSTSPIQ
jgi:hypothetical protein